MNEVVHLASSYSYYLPLQLFASVLFALITLSLGLLLAWFLWGRSKGRALQIEQKNQALRVLLEQGENPIK